MFKRKKYMFAVKKTHPVRNAILCILGIAAIAAAAFVMYSQIRPVRRSITVEAGSGRPSEREFLKDSRWEGEVSLRYSEEGEPDWNVPGEYKLTLVCGEKEYRVKAHVKDTIAPQAQSKEVFWFSEDEGAPNPMDFVTEIKDVTSVQASYEKEPDMKKTGEQEVTIILTDEGDNRTRILSKLTITDDKQAPIIYGVKDRLTYLGTAIPLNDGIGVVDDKDESPRLTVDDSAVNFQKRGVYPVTYRAVDRAGNVAEASASVTVSYFRKSAVDIDKLNEALDGLLGEITSEEMTQTEKCRAVWSWAQENVARSSAGSDKTAWTKEAYRVVQKKRGDSFTASAFFHGCMLRLGFQDMMVEGASHAWNLVNLGSGWFHVDCTNAEAFLLNDQSLAQLSQTSGGDPYQFDKSLFPPSN